MYDRLCNVMGPSRTCSDLPGRADLQVGGRQVPRGLNVFASMEIDVQSVAKQHGSVMTSAKRIPTCL